MADLCTASRSVAPRLTKAPVAIERDNIGLSPEERRTVRQERSRPRVEALGIWLREQYARLPPNSQVAKAIAYSLNAWDALVRFLDDGRRAAAICTLIETAKLGDVDPQDESAPNCGGC